MMNWLCLKINFYFCRNIADLSLDYLKVAQAAQFCSAHFTALLYVELWCQTRLENLNLSEKHYTLTLLDFICQKEDPQIQQSLQSIMRKVSCSKLFTS